MFYTVNKVMGQERIKTSLFHLTLVQNDTDLKKLIYYLSLFSIPFVAYVPNTAAYLVVAHAFRC